MTKLCEVWEVYTLVPGVLVIGPPNNDTLNIINPVAEPTYGGITLKCEAVYVPDYVIVLGKPWVEAGDPLHPGATGGLAARDCDFPKGPKIKQQLSVAWNCCCYPPFNDAFFTPDPTTLESR